MLDPFLHFNRTAFLAALFLVISHFNSPILRLTPLGFTLLLVGALGFVAVLADDWRQAALPRWLGVVPAALFVGLFVNAKRLSTWTVWAIIVGLTLYAVCVWSETKLQRPVARHTWAYLIPLIVVAGLATVNNPFTHEATLTISNHRYAVRYEQMSFLSTAVNFKVYHPFGIFWVHDVNPRFSYTAAPGSKGDMRQFFYAVWPELPAQVTFNGRVYTRGQN
ncbi:hypothetical protein [Lacticaseibacillus daqingensis]|uniref:hypothetical protein n=1 Tax=Lacticaseibacillus daqingensis TaxID=2486014 RepID=UPI000F7671A6|nr:hypothetical protein [Lacticaseibacillus daqingensis]